MRWFIYNFLFTIAYCLMLPKFFLRMKKRGGYRANFNERFAKFSPEVIEKIKQKKRIWVHAVSVGEANLAGSVIEELRTLNPGTSFIISTTSSTGRGICEKIAKEDDVVIYLPIDFPFVVRRMLRLIDVDLFVLTESEFWPNIIRGLKKKGTDIILVNGRVSDKSAPGYKKLRYFFSDVFKCFSLMLVQSDIDKQRLIDAGANAEIIKVMGSVKFDIKKTSDEANNVARATLKAAGIKDDDIVIMGGSTWQGEEVALVNAWKSINRSDVKLILVPRHMERGDEVEKELLQLGVKSMRRSRMKNNAESITPADDVVLMVDTTGELSALYQFADIVFVGKTLSPNVGGQNMIEPAAEAKAVIVGPHTENFVPVMNVFRKNNAMIEIDSVDKLEETIKALVEDKEKRCELGNAAKKAVDSQRGALKRSALEILKYQR